MASNYVSLQCVLGSLRGVTRGRHPLTTGSIDLRRKRDTQTPGRGAASRQLAMLDPVVDRTGSHPEVGRHLLHCQLSRCQQRPRANAMSETQPPDRLDVENTPRAGRPPLGVQGVGDFCIGPLPSQPSDEGDDVGRGSPGLDRRLPPEGDHFHTGTRPTRASVRFAGTCASFGRCSTAVRSTTHSTARRIRSASRCASTASSIWHPASRSASPALS
jgi:hypothetical protein